MQVVKKLGLFVAVLTGGASQKSADVTVSLIVKT